MGVTAHEEPPLVVSVEPAAIRRSTSSRDLFLLAQGGRAPSAETIGHLSSHGSPGPTGRFHSIAHRPETPSVGAEGSSSPSLSPPLHTFAHDAHFIPSLGVYVRRCLAVSAVDRGSHTPLLVGDVILEVEGVRVSSAFELVEVLESVHDGGESVAVLARRGEETTLVHVNVSRMQPPPPLPRKSWTRQAAASPCASSFAPSPPPPPPPPPTPDDDAGNVQACPPPSASCSPPPPPPPSPEPPPPPPETDASLARLVAQQERALQATVEVLEDRDREIARLQKLLEGYVPKKSLQQAQAAHREDLTRAQGRCGDLESTVQRLQAELAASKDATSTLRAQLAQERRRRQRSTSPAGRTPSPRDRQAAVDSGRLRRELATAQRKLKEATGEVNRMREALESAETDRARKAEALSVAEETAAAATAASSQAQYELAKEKAEGGSLRRALDSARKGLVDVTVMMASLRGEYLPSSFADVEPAESLGNRAMAELGKLVEWNQRGNPLVRSASGSGSSSSSHPSSRSSSAAPPPSHRIPQRSPPQPVRCGSSSASSSGSSSRRPTWGRRE